MRDGQWRIRRAEPGDVNLVAALLDETAGWLRAKEVHQWPARFDPEVLMPAVHAGETWLALSEDAVIATITVAHHDPAWRDLPGAAAYVHRLSVRRHGAGLGTDLLAWAAHEAAALGRDRLRLDCLASNARLCRYYEDLGFQPRGTVVVGGGPGQRVTSTDTAQTVVRRFEGATPDVAPVDDDTAMVSSVPADGVTHASRPRQRS